jgi:hypothetical protein
MGPLRIAMGLGGSSTGAGGGTFVHAIGPQVAHSKASCVYSTVSSTMPMCTGTMLLRACAAMLRRLGSWPWVAGGASW